MKEPDFLEDLKARIEAGDEWVPPLPKKILKKKISGYFKVSLRKSVIFHLIIMTLLPTMEWLDNYLGWQAERRERLAKRMDLARSAIRVDMVDLPNIKVSEMAQVDLTKEVGDSEPEPEEVKPTPKAMNDKTITPEMEAKRRAAENDRIEEELKKAESQRIKDIQDRLRASQRRQDMIERLKEKQKANSEGGRQALAGNIISEGYSATGDVAKDVDIYNGKAGAHIRKHFNVPAWVQASNLNARVLVKIAPDGRVIAQLFLKRSGNMEFDNYVEKALKAADPFPAPPGNLARTFMEEGFECGFPK